MLAAAATKDAIEHAGLTESEVQSPDTGIILGTGAGASSPDVIAMCDRLRKRGAVKLGAYHTPIIMGSSLTANLGSVFKIHGHFYSITSACATSAHAIMLGLDTIRSQRQKRVIVGGSEDINVYNAGSFEGMHALSAGFNDAPEKSSRPLDRDRDGFVFSGGAGILILEELESAKARGAEIHAIIAGAGATCDGDEMVVPSGLGAERAMSAALADAEVAVEDIDYINLHGTSTPIGDVIELDAVKRVFGSQCTSVFVYQVDDRTCARSGRFARSDLLYHDDERKISGSQHQPRQPRSCDWRLAHRRANPFRYHPIRPQQLLRLLALANQLQPHHPVHSNVGQAASLPKNRQSHEAKACGRREFTMNWESEAGLSGIKFFVQVKVFLCRVFVFLLLCMPCSFWLGLSR